MIIEKIIEKKGSKLTQWPISSNRASEMGHPCVRYLVFNRTRWQEKALPDVGLQLIFDLGNLFEQAVLDDLREAKIPVIEQQRAFEWKEYQITGHIDGKILLNEHAYPLEIKSSSPFVFDRIKTVKDMQTSKYVYMRKYPAQMMLYLMMDKQEKGVIIFKNEPPHRSNRAPLHLNLLRKVFVPFRSVSAVGYSLR